MTVIDEVGRVSDGAQFRRADLHVHSYGASGSYDVNDATMTPENIVDTAMTENLQVIAITDHNQIGNVRRALQHAQGKAILVVPGVELSTPQGHLLVYFPTVDALERFYGKLTISADKKQCHHTIAQCLQYGEEFVGFGICAHIELETGIEGAHPKYDAFKQEVLNCPNLLGLEVAHAINSNWFTSADESVDRRNCCAARRLHLGQEDEVELAHVMSSDAHTLRALGRNSSGNRRLTRVKMEALTFDALRIALLDAAARVRLEDLVPPSIPRFVGMKLEGGFLKDQVVHFSRNLTCIIGGRGAGKSTMLESLRVASGNWVENSVVDSEVWPDEISLIYEDEVGQRHLLTRSKLKDCSNANPDGPTRIAIESYGQGETAETIHHCDKDPGILLKFLDGFVDLSEQSAADTELRDQLLENQSLIETLQQDINKIADTEKAKTIADTQVATLKKQNASEVVALEEKLAKERRFRDQLKSNLTELLTSINTGITSEELRNLMTGQDVANLTAGQTEFDLVKRLVNELAAEVDTFATQLKTKVTEANRRILAELQTWSTKERETQGKVEDLRRDLEKQGIRLDIAFIRKVTKDATDYAAKLGMLRNSLPKQQEAFKQRRELLKARRELKNRQFMIRQAFAATMNRNLATTVVEYGVTIRFREGVLSTAFEELVKSAMGWRTSQVPKASLIAAQISPTALLDAVNDEDTTILEKVTDQDNNKVFLRAEAANVLKVLSEWGHKCSLERCAFEDRPEIKVSKPVAKADGKSVYQVRDFSMLSLGQQQSILLSILLFSKSTAPLIIDQPEDNLDSEFIYKTLVRSLRSIKERRQVIIVTHNANIAVLGDAELIVPLRGASEFSVIRERGSIDTGPTKEIVCTILEGSKKAFMRRHQVYGY